MKTDREGTLGLYIHVPFCLGKCLYCDFYSGAFPKETRHAYVRALCAHLRAWAPPARELAVDTVYFGGGTPTLLDSAEICAILNTVRGDYDLQPDAEITIECNPATLGREKAEELFAAGVNRVSIGAQSTQENELRALGRRHSVKDFFDTVSGVKSVGFSNISADLMFGIPEQTIASFSETLDAVIALDLPHISAYGLRIEEGTPFFGAREKLALPNEDDEADMQLLVAKKLGAAGLLHYEISNYAKPGFASRHNLRYWMGAPYLGFGPGAHSYFQSLRFSTDPDLAAYLAAVQEGRFDALCKGRELIAGKEAMDEYVMLRMRLIKGVDEADFAHRFGTSMEAAYGDLSRLVAGGFLVREAGRVAFTEKGLYVSNAILSDWLDFGKDPPAGSGTALHAEPEQKSCGGSPAFS